MKKRSLIAVLAVFLFSFTILISPAYAGNVQRHRWQGIAIGIGTAILGSALLNSHHQYKQRMPVYDRSDSEYKTAPTHRTYSKHRSHKKRGYWELQKEWVPPTYKKVWNPGHYNRHGKWMSGHWIKIEDESGYWEATRVWVAKRKHNHY